MHGHKIINQNGLHFLTMTTVGWVDAFTRQKYREIIIDSLRHCQKYKGLVINAYVIMSNHLHLIGYAKEGYELSAIVRGFKKFTSKQIIQDLIQNTKESRSEWMLRLLKYYAKYNKNNTTYQFWQQHNQLIELVSPKWILQKIAYVHLNPVRNGIVELAEHYVYSSARQYLGKHGLLEVEVIDLGSLEGYISI
ncbi:MAG: transposase [Bacteroidota bacterium]